MKNIKTRPAFVTLPPSLALFFRILATRVLPIIRVVDFLELPKEAELWGAGILFNKSSPVLF